LMLNLLRARPNKKNRRRFRRRAQFSVSHFAN
jgi:hypothetical protein